MHEDIFDISFESDGQSWKGWVNPSEKLSEEGRPVSFHVVLNNTSFGYLSYKECRWSANEQRPAILIEKIGEAIEKHYSNRVITNNR